MVLPLGSDLENTASPATDLDLHRLLATSSSSSTSEPQPARKPDLYSRLSIIQALLPILFGPFLPHLETIHREWMSVVSGCSLLHHTEVLAHQTVHHQRISGVLEKCCRASEHGQRSRLGLKGLVGPSLD